MPKKSKAYHASNYSDIISRSVISQSGLRKIYALEGNDKVYLDYPTPGLSVYGGGGDDEFESTVTTFSYTKKNKKKTYSKLAPKLFGDAGNDRFSDQQGTASLISGGDGDDKIRYHTNKGARSFDKGTIKIDGGNGNDRISYWSMEGIDISVHGGEGDDLIGIGSNREGKHARKQSFYGDGGDDTFYLSTPLSDPITRFYGGDGYDTFLIDTNYEGTIVSRYSSAEGEETIVFAAWRVNGIVKESKIILNGIELVGTDGYLVSYKHGNQIDDEGVDRGTASEAWSDNQGFWF